jgi:hypothetical protein
MIGSDRPGSMRKSDARRCCNEQIAVNGLYWDADTLVTPSALSNPTKLKKS